MTEILTRITQRLRAEEGVIVVVTGTAGSAPREVGAWMMVFAADVIGTVGGGHLEFDAIDHARRLLQGVHQDAARKYTLGPSLGQCCGGSMALRFERVRPSDVERVRRMLAPCKAPVALFGGGHVGRAIVHALAPLPYGVTWIDSRDGVFPAQPPEGVTCEHSDPVHGAVPQLASGSRVLVMSFSHAEDLDIVAACLRRLRDADDLPYVGLIGSETKWATFRHRLEARGFTAEELARITCPIGVPGIRGKEPEVIAASTVAQILQVAPPYG